MGIEEFDRVKKAFSDSAKPPDHLQEPIVNEAPSGGPIILDDAEVLRGVAPARAEAEFRQYRVTQEGGLELVQLQLEGPVGEIDRGADPNAVRTNAFWMPKSDLFVDPHKPELGAKAWDTVLAEHSLPRAWGERTRVVYANIPKGEVFECKVSRVEGGSFQSLDGTVENTPGGGTQLEFGRGAFRPDWVVFDREDPLQADRVLGQTDLSDQMAFQKYVDRLGHQEVRSGQLFDQRYRPNVPVLDDKGEPRIGPDGRYVWQ